MRLIDADELENSLRISYDKQYALYDNANDEDKPEYGESIITWLEMILRVKAAQTVDAVDVVRCGDCKHFNPDDQAAQDADWSGW